MNAKVDEWIKKAQHQRITAESFLNQKESPTNLDNEPRYPIGQFEIRTIAATTMFGNPDFIDHWAHEAHIDPNAATSLDNYSSDVTAAIIKQTSKVVEGISLSQEKRLDAAILKYSRALEIDPDCVDAFVARGAAWVLHIIILSYANQLKLDKAIADHTTALKIQPFHVNARIYLNKCVARLKEIEDEKQSAVEGEFLMPIDYQSNRRNNKIPLTKNNASIYAATPQNSVIPSSTANPLSARSTSSTLLSSSNAVVEVYDFVHDGIEDTVEPPPPPPSQDSTTKHNKKRKKDSKKSKKSRSKEDKKKKKSSGSKKRKHAESDSDDQINDSGSSVSEK
ncbi:Tetratricopeptide repeat protein 14 [Physocladia obscura]|uniref:Tetratricopeptide repeat protein 14 n=1 Tax=Physocladia obscura TaxID=109957 RepID=A0AAD5XMK3_9FUNG|nr:Tetratricopeptide repeat protein 14 [Physocladia obscura]